MRADRIEAVAMTGEEHYRMMVNRPFYYAYPMRGKTVYAYTKEEWGIGASSGGGDHNLIRSFYFSLAMTVLLAPVALGCVLFGLLALFEMPIMALVMVSFGALFGFGVLQCCFNVKREWRGRNARKLKGLPKPWWRAADDHAYEWFLKHPSPHIPATLEYFPESRILRKQAAI